MYRVPPTTTTTTTTLTATSTIFLLETFTKKLLQKN